MHFHAVLAGTAFTFTHGFFSLTCSLLSKSITLLLDSFLTPAAHHFVHFGLLTAHLLFHHLAEEFRVIGAAHTGHTHVEASGGGTRNDATVTTGLFELVTHHFAR